MPPSDPARTVRPAFTVRAAIGAIAVTLAACGGSVSPSATENGSTGDTTARLDAADTEPGAPVTDAPVASTEAPTTTAAPPPLPPSRVLIDTRPRRPREDGTGLEQ